MCLFPKTTESSGETPHTFRPETHLALLIGLVLDALQLRDEVLLLALQLLGQLDQLRLRVLLVLRVQQVDLVH